MINKREQRDIDYFKVFSNNVDVISRVTFWGVDDNHSWKNNWPMPSRTDYPLFFDRDYKEKKIINKIKGLIK